MCVVVCYCGDIELLDCVGGYVFGVCNCLFVENFVVDGCFKLFDDLWWEFLVVL